uniref:TSC22 domain family member 3 n=1 Tax=Dromaius novaehollandiae TaxID=8790 RepID=A0A8C4J0S8_DRONO
MSSSPAEECRSPVGLDCCSCCLDLANRSGLEEGAGGENNNLGSPTVSSFRQLQEQLVHKNLNTDKLSSIMRQDSLEPVVRDPCYLFNQGICNRNIDQTLLSILLLFHRWSPQGRSGLGGGCENDPSLPAPVHGGYLFALFAHGIELHVALPDSCPVARLAEPYRLLRF